MEKVMDPYTLVIEAQIYITKYDITLTEWIEKKKKYSALLEREEYLTEIETRHFKDVLETINTLLINIGPVASRCKDAITYISRNAEELRKTEADAVELENKIKESQKRLEVVNTEVNEKKEKLKEMKSLLQAVQKLEKELEEKTKIQQMTNLSEMEMKFFVQDAYKTLKNHPSRDPRVYRVLAAKMNMHKYPLIPPLIRKALLFDLTKKVITEKNEEWKINKGEKLFNPK